MNLFKNIRTAIKINKEPFQIEGRKFYYSPQTTTITLIILLIVISFFVWQIVSTEYILLDCFSILMLTYFIVNMLHKVIFKRPVFVLVENKLYYSKMGIWLNLEDCYINDDIVGKFNWSGTLTIECEKSDVIIQENLWYIEYDDELKKYLKKYFKRKSF